MKKKIEPQDPYECWCTNCIECEWWREKTKKCEHPIKLEMEQWQREQIENAN